MSPTDSTARKFDYDRIPYLVVFDDTSAYRDTYGGVTESVVLESYLLQPKESARTPSSCSCTPSAVEPIYR